MNKTITKNQFSILAIFIMCSLFLGSTVFGTIKLAKEDAWISMILSYLISVIPLFIYYKLLSYNPEINIIELIIKKFKILGKFINLVFIILILFHSGIVLWNLTNFINSQYLYQTPALVITILFLCCIFYIVNAKLNVIGKTAGTIWFITTFLCSLAFIALSSHIEINNIKPILENGMTNILKGSGVSICYNTLPLFTLLIIPKKNIKNNHKLVKSFLTFYSFGFLFLAGILFFCISVFGIDLATLYQYPEYQILKIINIADFFQRVESIISTIWLFNITMALVTYIYFCENAIVQNFNIKDSKLLIFFICLIILLISRLTFKNNTIAENFLLYKYPIIIFIVLFIIPLLILIAIKIKRN